MTEREIFAAGFRAGQVGLHPQTVTAIVANYYAFDMSELTSEQRTHRISQARKAIAWALRKFTTRRAFQVAKMLNRDRSIYYYSYEEYETSLDPNIRREVEEITDLIRAEVQKQYDEAIPF